MKPEKLDEQKVHLLDQCETSKKLPGDKTLMFIFIKKSHKFMINFLFTLLVLSSFTCTYLFYKHCLNAVCFLSIFNSLFIPLYSSLHDWYPTCYGWLETVNRNTSSGRDHNLAHMSTEPSSNSGPTIYRKVPQVVSAFTTNNKTWLQLREDGEIVYSCVEHKRRRYTCIQSCW